MSVSLVVIRLELAEHSPVPAGFGFSAAGECRGLAAPRVAGAWAPGGAGPPQGRAWGGPRGGLLPQEEAEGWGASPGAPGGGPARPPSCRRPRELCLHLARRCPALGSVEFGSRFPLGFVKAGAGFPATRTVPGLIKSFLFGEKKLFI